LYVDILEELYKEKLQRYEGSSPLSAWLTVVVRRRSLDALRARYGRVRPPKGLDELSGLEQLLFQLHHVERLGIPVIATLLPWHGYDATAEDITRAIVRIEETIDARYLRRLDDTHFARVNGTGGYRVLRYVIEARINYEHRVSRNAPDRSLLEHEAKRTAERVRELVRALPERERRVIELRFDKGMRAREISEALGLGGRRKTYTIIDRVIRRMRAALGPRGNGASAESGAERPRSQRKKKEPKAKK
jgi:RNA polymerase sigma factor (sigma-70 family)